MNERLSSYGILLAKEDLGRHRPPELLQRLVHAGFRMGLERVPLLNIVSQEAPQIDSLDAAPLRKRQAPDLEDAVDLAAVRFFDLRVCIPISNPLDI